MYHKRLSPIIASLGRRTVWRIGRLLYMHARADYPNRIDSNGEMWLQSIILENQRDRKKITVFDVGANIGDWTLLFTELATAVDTSTDLEIHSFEPVPETFIVLQKRTMAREHEWTNISVNIQQVAASSIDKESLIYLDGATVGTNSMHPAMQATAPKKALKINCVAIDSYCRKQSIDFIDLLKCDAEGHDFEVICGAREMLIAGNIAILQFEYNHRWIHSRHYLKDVFDLVSDLPYKVGKLTPNRIEVYKSWHHELERFFEANYILIHKDYLCQVPHTLGTFDISNTYLPD